MNQFSVLDNNKNPLQLLLQRIEFVEGEKNRIRSVNDNNKFLGPHVNGFFGRGYGGAYNKMYLHV